MKFFIGLLTVVVLSVSSCYHEPDAVKPEPKVDIPFGSYGFDYLPADSGNYWVYNTYKIDTFGKRTLLPGTDSIWACGDSILNDVAYKCFKSRSADGSGFTLLYKDSSGHVVNQKGVVRYSAVNFWDTFYYHIVLGSYDTLLVEKSMMKVVDEPMQVPSGVFSVVDFETTVSILDPDDPVAHLFPRKAHNYYAKGVGMVSRTYFYLSSTGNTYETVLSHYYVASEE